MHATILATGSEDTLLIQSVPKPHQVFFMEQSSDLSGMSEIFSLSEQELNASRSPTNISGRIEIWQGESHLTVPIRPWKIQNLISPARRKEALKAWLKAIFCFHVFI